MKETVKKKELLYVDPFKYIQAKWVYGYQQAIDAIEKLGLGAGSTLLLLGCGLGKTAILAAQRFGCNVIGADINPLLVEKAQKLADRKGMKDRVRFVFLNGDKPYTELSADAVFFESILSFLNNPADVLAHYLQKINFQGRIGVLEITIADSQSNVLMDTVREIFGEEANFRDEVSWLGIFKKAGFEMIEKDMKPIGLKRKFWDDLRAQPIGTFVDLSKTLYMSYTDQKAKKSMRLFRKFFKNYSSKMVCGCYVLKRSESVDT